jgi:hypothetical protein
MPSFRGSSVAGEDGTGINSCSFLSAWLLRAHDRIDGFDYYEAKLLILVLLARD